MNSDAPARPVETVRILQARSVDWAKAEARRTDRKEDAKPYTGKMLGLDVIDGYVRVHEGLTYRTRKADGGYANEPLWHVFVRDERFVDATPERAPETPPPAYPYLPTGEKPCREEERRRLSRMLGTRAARHIPESLYDALPSVVAPDLFPPMEPVGKK